MNRLLHINTPLGEGKALLMAMSGRERLGELSEYRLSLVTQRGSIKADELLGKNITVGVELPGGRTQRYFNGYITQFSEGGAAPSGWLEGAGGGRAYLYHLTMHPWLWFLTRSANFRIFQNMTVPQIVQQVCDEYPFALLGKSMLSGTYAAREYVCQYRETDFNFVLRLLEQEGIYFSFVHDNGKHTMQLYDTHGAHTAYAGYASVPYSGTSSAHAADEEYISQWNTGYEAASGRYSLSDYDFKKPRISLLSSAARKPGHDLDGFEFFDYPGEYATLAEGNTLSKIRLEELQAGSRPVAAAGPVRGLAPGCVFTLKDHPTREYNKEYLVVSASYSMANNQPTAGGAAAEFRCDFQVTDSKIQFRPARKTPKPMVAGPQSAVVVGPAGEEVHVDAHGRVKLQFRWDRYNKADENSSCWVRVSQPWASKNWGVQFLPRIGHEVLVEFLDGDPDQPVVIGRLHNGEAAPPWPLPEQKTRSGIRTRTVKGSSANFNELSFDDKQGAEEFYMQAERDQVIRVKNDRYEDIGKDSHQMVHKDTYTEVQGDAHFKVKGDHNQDAGGSWSLKVAQDSQTKAGQKFAVDAGQEIHLKAGMKVVIEAGTSVSLKVGGNFVSVTPAGVFIKGTMVMVNSGGDGGSGSGASPIAPKPPKAPRTSTGGEDLKPVRPTPPQKYSPQAQALKLAWKAGTPFCEKCEAAKQAAAAKG